MSMSAPLVVGSATAGTCMPGRWRVLPSSIGTGKSGGSTIGS
jgi:hypothetical protein